MINLSATLKFLPLLLFGGIIAGFAFQKPTLPTATGYLDRQLPDFELPAIAGMEGGLSNKTLGGEVVLLNVFASWCAACKQEHPMLMGLSVQNDLPIYGLNWRDRKGAANLFLTKHGDPYLASGEDRSGVLGAELGVTGVPETLIIDIDGRIRYRHIGPITPDIWSAILLPIVQNLQGES